MLQQQAGHLPCLATSAANHPYASLAPLAATRGTAAHSNNDIWSLRHLRSVCSREKNRAKKRVREPCLLEQQARREGAGERQGRATALHNSSREIGRETGEESRRFCGVTRTLSGGRSALFSGITATALISNSLIPRQTCPRLEKTPAAPSTPTMWDLTAWRRRWGKDRQVSLPSRCLSILFPLIALLFP